MHHAEQHNSRSNIPTGGLRVVLLLLFLLAYAGCGEQGRRLMKLATFQSPTVEEDGPIFSRMMLAYYEIDVQEFDSVSRESLQAVEKRLSAGIADEIELEALRSLLEIEAVDRAVPRPADAQVDDLSAHEIWLLLSPRSQLAFAREFP